MAKKQLDPSKPPDLSHTEPAVQIGPYPAWSGTPRNSARNSARNSPQIAEAPSVVADPEKIVAIDPWGHLVGRKGGPGKPGGGGAAPSIAVSATNLQLHEVREAMDAGMPRNSAQFCAILRANG